MIARLSKRMTKKYEYAKDTPVISEIYKAAIKADMGIGEEPYGFAAKKYKDYDGEYVVAQRNQWGDM